MEFKLPDLGENIESGDVTQVLVSVGDAVSEGQAVLEGEYLDREYVDVIQREDAHHFGEKPRFIMGTQDDARNGGLGQLLDAPCEAGVLQAQGELKMPDHVVEVGIDKIAGRDLVAELQNLGLRKIGFESFENRLLLLFSHAGGVR